MSEYPRLPPRLSRIFPNDPLFFITFCTHRRKSLLATAAVNTALEQFVRHAYETYGIAVGRYVIVPEHGHLFVRRSADFRLGRWIGTLKQALAKVINGRRSAGPIWQRGFFDHVLRSDESYGQKWNYIRDNPVRAGLVTKADDWPYAGEIVVIDRV